MAINFPSSPVSGDTHTHSGVVYEYTGSVWKARSSLGLPILPTFDLECYATASTASTSDIALNANVGSPTIGLNIGVVGVDGETHGHTMGFASTAFTVSGYSLNNGSFTITAWVYPGALNSGVANRFLVGSQTTPGTQYEVSLRYNQRLDNTSAVVDEWYTLRFSVDGDSTGVTGTTVMRPNTWYHVAVTFNNLSGSGTATCYVNAVHQHSRVFPIPGTRSIVIGGLGVSPTMVGLIKFVRFYDQALTQRQVYREMLETQDPYAGWPSI